MFKKNDKAVEIHTTIGGDAQINIKNLGGNMNERQMKSDAKRLMETLSILPIGTLTELKKMMNDKTHIGETDEND